MTLNAKMFPCGVCGEDMGNHPVGGPCPRDMPQAKHPRIDDALAQLRLHFPSSQHRASLLHDFSRRHRGTDFLSFTLADGSDWRLIAIDLESDTLKLWRMR